MRKAGCVTLLVLLLAHLALTPAPSPTNMLAASAMSADELPTSTVVQPLYLRFQFLGNESSVVLTHALPRDFDNGLAERRNILLALMISKNARSFDIYQDTASNTWLRVNFTVRKGDYVSTLTWVHSELGRENLSLPTRIEFPYEFPTSVEQYVEPGYKIPSADARIRQVSDLVRADNMLTTVVNALNYTVNTQVYDSEKSRLALTGGVALNSYMDYMRDPIAAMEERRSICLERSLFVVSVLRGAGVPARTTTNFWLKSSVEVWFPGVGWVDADCTPDLIFPQSFMTTVPLMVQNSSDAQFAFDWYPRAPMRIVNTTLTDPIALRSDEFGTLVAEPVDELLFNATRGFYSVPLSFEPAKVSLAVLRQYSSYRVAIGVGDVWKYQYLNLHVSNDISEGGWTMSFYPVQRFGFLNLENLSLYPGGFHDLWVIPLVVAVGIVALVYAFRGPIFGRRKVIEAKRG